MSDWYSPVMRDDKSAHWPCVAAVVFDLDGVLVDSEPVFCRELRAFLAPAALTDEQYVSIVGISEAETWHWVKATYGRRESIEELSAASREFPYHALSTEPLAALAGAPELVRALRAAGCRLAVASQSLPRWVRTTLDAIGMADAFDYVVTASGAVSLRWRGQAGDAAGSHASGHRTPALVPEEHRSA